MVELILMFWLVALAAVALLGGAAVLNVRTEAAHAGQHRGRPGRHRIEGWWG